MDVEHQQTLSSTPAVAYTGETLPPGTHVDLGGLPIPTGVSAINIPSEIHTLSEPVSQNEHPLSMLSPTMQSEPPAALSFDASSNESPRGRPPIFYPDRAQQFPPGEEMQQLTIHSSPVTSNQLDATDIEMHESLPPNTAHAAAHSSPQLPAPPVRATSTPNAPPPALQPAGPSTAPFLRPTDYGAVNPRYRRFYREDPFVYQRVPAAYMFKLLGDKLAGVIMGCTDETKQECLTDEVFGLPAKHWDYLQYVQEGVTFYLFNYSRRSLHGIFKSVEPATWQLKSNGWCRSPHQVTQFPAQIRVTRVDSYPCLTEDEYKPILEWKNNYIEHTSKFSFELDSEQVDALNQLFEQTKAQDPGRLEPPLAIKRPQNGGFAGNGGGSPRQFGRSGFGYGNRLRRPPFTPRGSSFGGRGTRPSRGAHRGRVPIGSTHPLANSARAKTPPPTANETTRIAYAPPPRPAVTLPPGMVSLPPRSNSSAAQYPTTSSNTTNNPPGM